MKIWLRRGFRRRHRFRRRHPSGGADVSRSRAEGRGRRPPRAFGNPGNAPSGSRDADAARSRPDRRRDRRPRTAGPRSPERRRPRPLPFHSRKSPGARSVGRSRRWRTRREQGPRPWRRRRPRSFAADSLRPRPVPTPPRRTAPAPRLSRRRFRPRWSPTARATSPASRRSPGPRPTPTGASPWNGRRCGPIRIRASPRFPPSPTAHPSWPSDGYLRYREEAELMVHSAAPAEALAFFAAEPPQSSAGKLALARALGESGKTQRGDPDRPGPVARRQQRFLDRKRDPARVRTGPDPGGPQISRRPSPLCRELGGRLSRRRARRSRRDEARRRALRSRARAAASRAHQGRAGFA